MAIDPLDMTPDARQFRLINVGLSLARTEGFGLPLVNALRERFPDVTIQDIGRAVTTIGQGVNAATLSKMGPPGEQIALESLPVVPSAFFKPGETDRLAALSDVTFGSLDSANPNYTGGYHTWDVRVECGEGITFQDLIDCIESMIDDNRELFSEYDLDVGTETNRQINLYFIGKRF